MKAKKYSYCIRRKKAELIKGLFFGKISTDNPVYVKCIEMLLNS